LRGSRDFPDRKAYQQFLESLVTDRNRRRHERLAEEQAVMRALPARPLPACRDEFATVTRWSTVRIGKKAYSVPSRLRGERLHVRLFASRVELLHQGEVVGIYDRLARDEPYRIDYRHLIHSLVKKPGAFARYVYRDALFPTLNFRRTYDVLDAQMTHGADLEYLRILHLAAMTMEAEVDAVLSELLARGERPTFDRVKTAVTPQRPPYPEIALTPPDLDAYDALLSAGAR
jgi:hypothetical protein